MARIGAFFVGAALCSVVTTMSSCQSYAVLPDEDRARLEQAHSGAILFLRQSLYVGPFYDDDRYKLVHPRRFEELTYLENAEGEAIVPPPAEGVIPAGTRVRIESIEWPTGEAVFRRPVFTPRYTTWIWMRVARDRGPDVTHEREGRHILLMPGGIENSDTFEMWFDATFTAEDPNPWIVSLPEEQRRAIALKRPLVGMNYDALTTSLGFPDTLTRRTESADTVEVGVWGALSITLRNGVVEQIRDPAASMPQNTEPSASSARSASPAVSAPPKEPSLPVQTPSSPQDMPMSSEPSAEDPMTPSSEDPASATPEIQ